MAPQAVIQGTVSQAGRPVGGAYVRLSVPGGRLAAEVPTSKTGTFRFFAAPGKWTVTTLAPGSTVDRTVAVEQDQVSEVHVAI
jgi:hypothetical protein